MNNSGLLFVKGCFPFRVDGCGSFVVQSLVGYLIIYGVVQVWEGRQLHGMIMLSRGVRSSLSKMGSTMFL
jgi:hypothetical protein